MPKTSRDRVRAALAHREPDRIPFDLGGTRVTGIHVRAYERLRPALGLEPHEPRVADLTQQLAEVKPDVLDAPDAAGSRRASRRRCVRAARSSAQGVMSMLLVNRAGRRR